MNYRRISSPGRPLVIITSHRANPELVGARIVVTRLLKQTYYRCIIDNLYTDTKRNITHVLSRVLFTFQSE